jgi:hypothetical protein
MHNHLGHSQLRLRSQGGARSIFVSPRHGPVLQPDGGVEAKERRVSAETPEIVERGSSACLEELWVCNQVKTAGN